MQTMEDLVTCSDLCDLSYCDDVAVRICFTNASAPDAATIDATVKRLLQDCDGAPQLCLDSDADSFAYLVRLKSHPDSLYVVYRGTNTIEDLTKDADVFMQPLSKDTPDLCVHSGFAGIYRDLVPSVAPCVDAFMQQGGPDARLVFAGFSMGASVAAIAALVSARKHPGKVRFIGLGMPRTGNRAWATAFNEAVPGAIRVISASDPVAKLPVGAGYSHVGTAVHVGREDPYPDLAVPSALTDHKLASYIANVLAFSTTRNDIAAGGGGEAAPTALHMLSEFVRSIFCRLFGKWL